MEEGLAINRKILPPLHPDLATSLNNLGLLLHTMGRHDEARKHYEEALAIRRKALPPLRPQLAASLSAQWTPETLSALKTLTAAIEKKAGTSGGFARLESALKLQG